MKERLENGKAKEREPFVTFTDIFVILRYDVNACYLFVCLLGRFIRETDGSIIDFRIVAETHHD